MYKRQDKKPGYDEVGNIRKDGKLRERANDKIKEMIVYDGDES